MPKKSNINTKIITPTKVPAYYQIGILFPDGKKVTKGRVSLNELFETYFINLDKLISKDITGEELLEKYKDNFNKKGIKIQINYIDSWSHKWTGKVAWPRESKFIEYLNKRLNENYS